MKKRLSGKTKEEWKDEELYQAELASFKTWWEPYSCDEKSGASIGGQPEALRWWARPTEEGKWERRQYGEKAKRAFKAASYYNSWKAWKQEGEPIGQWVQFLDQNFDGTLITEIHDEAFVSNCLPIEESLQRLGEIYKFIGSKQYIA